MRQHHLTASVVALFTAVVLAIGGAAPAWAASQHPVEASTQAARAAPPAFKFSKIVLPDMSIDGPALSSIFEPNASFNRSVIAWTGTDTAHHLNVETSTDGLNFAHKFTLNETSPFRPDVTQVAGGPIVVAWTGTDANHSLNVLYGVYGSQKKLTLVHENSIAAPAIFTLGAHMYLAWTGTDANHSLNIMPITYTDSHLVAGQKTVLTQFSSNAGPHLTRYGTTHLVLNWTTRALQLNLADSPDGVTFNNTLDAGLPETSAFAPHTDFLGPYIVQSGMDWISWTGTDTAHHLNLQWSASGMNFPNPAETKITLGETAIGGPAQAFYAGDEQVAWTGTDTAHHLNIAMCYLTQH